MLGFINRDNTFFGWLKDNEGRYFIAVDTHIQRVANRTG
jgi:endonuclease-3